MIRCCCQHSSPNLLSQALTYYNELKELQIAPKSRTLTPLLAALATSKEWANICIEIFFSDLLELFQLIPTEKDYQSMLQIVLLKKDGTLFDRVYELLQQDVYIPMQATTDLLVSVFTSVLNGYSIHHAIPKEDGLLLFESHENEKIYNKIEPRRLISVEITNQQRSVILEDIEKFALNTTANIRGRNPTSSSSLSSTRKSVSFVEHWDAFQKWLEEKRTKTMVGRKLMIIDGANVGYFENNYQGAPKHVDYDKIQWMIEEV